MEMEDAEGQPLSVEDEEEIDRLSETIYPMVASRIDASGALNFPVVMPEVNALITERRGEEVPDSRIVYGAILLAAATEREGRIMREYL
jgi:hypothetical protein